MKNKQCPCCGQNPNVLTLHDNDKIISYVCCGYTAIGQKRWNQYAVAMDLAKALVAYEKAQDPFDVRNAARELDLARKCVIKIFGGE